MMGTPFCPDSDTLQEHLDGTLEEPDQSALVAHLNRCERCQEALEELAGGSPLLAIARQVGQEAIDQEPALRRIMMVLSDQGTEHEWGPREDRDHRSSLTLLGHPEASGCLGRLGSYAALEIIGHGSMGVVLKALDPKLRRSVAIKLLAPPWSTNPAARRRFAREARAVAAIRNEHVIDIFAVEERDGLPFLVMEYVAGGSLQDKLDRGKPLALEEILHIGTQTALGLAAAHAKGLIHRDIKPANLLLDEMAGRVKITDFGLARATDDARITQNGMVLGTPQYMAPEQARGDAIDHRADLFSLGSVLYAMCAGRLPFRGGETLAVLRRVSDDMPCPLRELNPEIPHWLEEIIARLHAKDPADRFQSAVEVAELLSRHLDQFQTCEKPASGGCSDRWSSLRQHKPKRRHQRWLIAAPALIVAASLGLAEGSGVTQLGATLITVLTPEGTLAVEVDDSRVKVTIEGEGGIVITGAGPQEVRLRPGSYRLNATRDGQTLKDELITITRGGRQIVRISREGAVSSHSSTAGELLRFEGHSARVWSVAFLPDGHRVLSGSDDGTMRLWDLRTDKQVRRFGHQARVGAVAVTPDGRIAITGGWSPIIRVWDVESGAELRRLEGHTDMAGSVAISADGRRALSGSKDKTLRLWDLATGKELRRFSGHSSVVRTVAFLNDGRRVLSGSHDGTARLWELESGQELRCINADSKCLHCATASPDCRWILTGGVEKVIRLWDLESGRMVREIADPAPLSFLSFSPDSRRFLANHRDIDLALWDVETGARLHTFEGHSLCVTSVATSPDGRRALSSSYDSTVRLWQLPP